MWQLKKTFAPQMLRRLDDRIRELCAKAVATEDSSELHDILQQLRASLHEHAKRLRKSALSRLFLAEKRAGSLSWVTWRKRILPFLLRLPKLLLTSQFKSPLPQSVESGKDSHFYALRAVWSTRSVQAGVLG
jgi:hypothetical protein